MADGNFIGPGDGPDEIMEVLQGKVVSGVKAESAAAGGLGGFQIAHYGDFRIQAVLGGIVCIVILQLLVGDGDTLIQMLGYQMITYITQTPRM